MIEKTLLITGASRGIGAEIAKLFAQNGYNISFCYKTSEKEAKAIENELLKYNVKVYSQKADLTQSCEIKSFVDNTISKFKKIDVLINNAGVGLQKLFIDCDENDYEYIFNSNIKSMILVTKFVLPNMLKYKKGKIINISSIWGEIGGSCEVLYSASKSACIGFTKALSKEYGLENINVNAISPGFILTDMNNNLSEKEIEDYKNTLSLNKLGTTSDVAELALFLASKKSDYITGQIIGINGGAY